MKKYSPTTPSRRKMTTVDYGVLSAAKPFKKLLKRLPKRAGRNKQGRITVRHQGGGNKKLYRIIDFCQNKLGVPAKVESLEYDPYRTAFIARILYRDGERKYILASKNLKVGDEIIISQNAPLKDGNRLELKNIPVGYLVHNIELNKGKGGQLSRSAGSYAEVLAQENNFTHLKLSSGEVRKVSAGNFASLGQLSNPDHNLVVIGKAGRSRWLGIRPTVRGSAMNPCDHPYGGGEGRALRGTKRPKTKWGKVTGGRKTRKKKKWSNKMIIKRRK
ncbi:MAG: 50S ribosomal protein L2 [Candidatus Paceibacterota bacterium]